MKTVRVKVKYFSFFQDITGKTEEYIHIHNHTVDGLVEILKKKYGTNVGTNTFSMRQDRNRLECMIVVNGKVADLDCALKDNDEVSLLQPMAGG